MTVYTLEKEPASDLRISDAHFPTRERIVKLAEWLTCLGDQEEWASPDFLDSHWKAVSVPHNWEDYQGYPAVSHGNLHGTAWYRTWTDWEEGGDRERLYAFFEGVGSYAQVFCNGLLVGEHAGGRTTFTVDLTPALCNGRNLIAVRAHHPEKIDDLPFVCGGCWGSPNTEGSQPFGIFRPAWLERTGPVRIEPFGLHILHPSLNHQQATIEARIELQNAAHVSMGAKLHTQITAPDGSLVLSASSEAHLAAKEKRTVVCQFPKLKNPRLWSPDTPHLYTATTEVYCGGECSHRSQTTFGLRWLDWPEVRQRQASKSARILSSEATQVILRSVKAPVDVQILPPEICVQKETLPDIANLQIGLRFQTDARLDAQIFCEIQDERGTVFFHQHRSNITLEGETLHTWVVPSINGPQLYTESAPCLHKLVLELRGGCGEIWQRQETYFAIRVKDGNLAQPPIQKNSSESEQKESEICEGTLRINGEPFFINGTCEYETLLGADHAFSEEQIAANVAMMRSAGFNAFRDAHHPHNLRYYDHWDQSGMLCWTQMGSHIWFDNARFRENFRRLVAEWVRERRNHPCIMLWGIQNESVIPEDFARELHDIICELDPSTPHSRLTTTCNGGVGTNWDVPQEWSGTYGGNFNDYNLAPLQLVGEYGAWRDFGVHTELDYLGDENDRSESWACQAMETKIRLGELARHKAVGHFHWIFNSFPNPGRTADNYEGPDNAEIGSINNKGLVTAWHQPSDLYYLFRANYADPITSPMVYIVSHTWPDRWKVAGARKVRVFSNCEEVELFNGEGIRSLGTRKHPGRGRHFTWENITLTKHVLCAIGRIDGREVARDIILLNHLEDDGLLPRWGARELEPLPVTKNRAWRVSCGNAEGLIDAAGRQWCADRPWSPDAEWGWESWAMEYSNVPADLASRGYTLTPVQNTTTPELYRTYRYGRSKLKYHFRLPRGQYRVRLHFAEPWFGVGGELDCTGWRVFDIEIGSNTVETDLDIWKESGGHHRALVRSFQVHHTGGILSIGFPRVAVNQALICALEVQELHPNQT